MTFLLADRVKQYISSTGTADLTLGGTLSSFVSFEDAIGEGNSTYYAIENLPNWEVGVGTYSAGVLSRDTVLASSNSGSKINITIGSSAPVVFCNYPATQSASIDTSGFITSFSGSFAGIKFPDGTTQDTAASNTRAFRTITANTSLVATDDVILVDTSSSPVTLTLPLASNMSGKTISFKFKSGINEATIVPQGVDNLDGGSSFVMNYVNQAISAFCDGDNWYIL